MIPDDPGATDKTNAELDAEQEAERSEFAEGFDPDENEDDDPYWWDRDYDFYFDLDDVYPWWGPDE